MHNPANLDGKVIVITGAAQGIGKALSEQCAKMGARIVAVDINPESLADSFSEWAADRVLTLDVDISGGANAQQAIADAIEHFGDVHGLINNAGIVRAAMITDMTAEQWQSVINVNLTGAFNCLQAVGRHFVAKAKDGDSNPGAIVNVSSDAGRKGTFGQINYGAAKSGMLGLTMSAAREWGRYNINVNSVCYGLVETAMTETIREKRFQQKYLDQIPLRRFSTPQDVAPATCFLLSDAASYITGQHLGIDGGFHISA